jgi:voltage-gated potassium channel
VTAGPETVRRMAPWRRRLHEIVFEADTVAGRAFDLAVVALILLAVLATMIETLPELPPRVHDALVVAEWVFTALFTLEYAARLVSVGRPVRYAVSFFGMVDLLSVLPTYLSLFFPGAQSLLVIRSLRLLRVFRILKLGRYLQEAHALRIALVQSRPKIVEGPEHGYTSLPESMYWAIVTMTTVGYGDISPKTALGRLIASTLMILGYALIIVPTGIVSAELAQQAIRSRVSTQACPECSLQGHDADARHCKWCGAAL